MHVAKRGIEALAAKVDIDRLRLPNGYSAHKNKGYHMDVDKSLISIAGTFVFYHILTIWIMLNS